MDACFSKNVKFHHKMNDVKNVPIKATQFILLVFSPFSNTINYTIFFIFVCISQKNEAHVLEIRINHKNYIFHVPISDLVFIKLIILSLVPSLLSILSTTFDDKTLLITLLIISCNFESGSEKTKFCNLLSFNLKINKQKKIICLMKKLISIIEKFFQ